MPIAYPRIRLAYIRLQAGMVSLTIEKYRDPRIARHFSCWMDFGELVDKSLWVRKHEPRRRPS
ncbi:hypothetical protein CCUS01_12751 [Colletotrichum cuscutae]|uniref:Uncharacterized protein n=1 Tax=Colletotrichum cuscutae TaxID=1209917 RepID=A0AAI9TWD9_9PEZI|nr:hypothetical protein CCUS01_12751 [Colletotrichum cuscutae]